MRKFYATLCFKENTKCFYQEKEGKAEVIFECGLSNGLKVLILSLEGNIIFCDGFNSSDIEFFQGFLRKNRSLIIAEFKKKS